MMSSNLGISEKHIGDFITIKLVGNSTEIYVCNEYFRHCKYLLLNIPVEEIPEFDEINSIDEAAEIMKKVEKKRREKEKELEKQINELETMDDAITILKSKNSKNRTHEFNKTRISPKEEFIGHCSNLQAWYENDYDTRILHSNLSFPLLKKLTEAGDPKAKKVFKDEIALRFEDEHAPPLLYLINEGYLNYFNREELEIIAENCKTKYIRDMVILTPFMKIIGGNSVDKKGTIILGITGLNKRAAMIIIDPKNDCIGHQEYVKSIPLENVYNYKQLNIGAHKYVDLGVSSSQSQYLLSYNAFKVAELYLNHFSDIEIHVPIIMDPFKISSKQASINIYITPYKMSSYDNYSAKIMAAVNRYKQKRGI